MTDHAEACRRSEKFVVDATTVGSAEPEWHVSTGCATCGVYQSWVSTICDAEAEADLWWTAHVEHGLTDDELMRKIDRFLSRESM